MGRKRTHHEATRTKIVSARLTPETFDVITEHARRLGLSRGGYIEHLIENRPLKLAAGAPEELSVPLINELKRIGNNLNQIAHARNAALPTDIEELRAVLSGIIELICTNDALSRRRRDGPQAHRDTMPAEPVGRREPVQAEAARHKNNATVAPPRRSVSPPVPQSAADGYAPESPAQVWPRPPAAAPPTNPAAPARPRRTEPPAAPTGVQPAKPRDPMSAYEPVTLRPGETQRPAPTGRAPPEQLGATRRPAPTPQPKRTRYDPPPPPPRPKFPWSLFVRSSRR